MDRESGLPFKPNSLSSEFKNHLKYVISDVDDTITYNGSLYPANLNALWELKNSGKTIILLTGGSAGWADVYIRQWPVDAVIAESGAVMLAYNSKREITYYPNQVIKAAEYKEKKEQFLRKTAGLSLSSDQYARLFDIAYDRSKLDDGEVNNLKNLIKSFGAYYGESSIHINVWFAPYNKLNALLSFTRDYFEIAESDLKEKGIYFGDSLNDQDLFRFMPVSVGMYRVFEHKNEFEVLPSYIDMNDKGFSFPEAISFVLDNK